MGTEQNPYQAYRDGSVYSDSPLNLVVALYEGALDATRQAENALIAGDIPKRTKAINQAYAILTELMLTLDHERGGEISKNLARLYDYMQRQLLTAHARKLREPIGEVASLLSTLLEGWRGAAQNQTPVCEHHAADSAIESAAPTRDSTQAAYASAAIYGGYPDEGFGSFSNTAYSF